MSRCQPCEHLLTFVCPCLPPHIALVTVQGTKFILRESLVATSTFKLTNPIICEDPQAICQVVVTITNSHPEDIAIDKCVLIWDRDDWHTPRTLEITAVEDFIPDGTHLRKLITSDVLSNSEYYNGTTVDDIEITTESFVTGNCRGTGDPHYTVCCVGEPAGSRGRCRL